MTAQAKIIPISEAREARRRRVAAEARVDSEAQAAKLAKAQEKAAKAREKADAVAAAKAAKAEEKAAKAAEKAAAKTAREQEKAAAAEAKRTTRTSVKASERVQKTAEPQGAHAADGGQTNSFAKGAKTAKATKGATAKSTKASAKASSSAKAASATASASSATAARATRTEASGERRTRKRYRLRGAVNNLLERPLAVGVAVFCTLIVLVGVFLYPTARTYYQAMREQARLEAEFQAVLDRNIRLASEIEFLQTDEGIIQKAHESLGWVEHGDNAVIVYGATLEDDSELDANIIPGTVEAPETWYSPFLDVFFGVK